MIQLTELLSGADINKLDKSIQSNLMDLLERINKVRTAWNKPMNVSSGLRTMEHHIEIYKEVALKNKKPFDIKNVPMKSKHLYGQAVDIADPKKELQTWCRANEALLLSIGLWMESFDATPDWCHFQIVQYGSWVPGKSIWFIPF